MEPLIVELLAEGQPELELEMGAQPVLELEMQQSIPDYDGTYSVTPTESEQTLATRGKRMRRDVTVEPIPPEYVIPSGTKPIAANGTHDVAGYASALVDVPAPPPALQAKSRSYSPTESQQAESIQPDSGYDGLSQVDVAVGAIPPNYVGSGIARRDSGDLAAIGPTVDVPEGYYASGAHRSVAMGSAGTPTAHKGDVVNHRVAVTPSVTNVGGWIGGGTIDGAYVEVSAAELVSGTKSIAANGVSDVTEYASVDVNVPATDSTLVVTLGWEDDYFAQDEGAWVPDCTFAEIQAAHAAEREIVIRTQGDDALADGWWYDGTGFFYGASVWDDDGLHTSYYEMDGSGIALSESYVTIEPNFACPTRTFTPSELEQTATVTYDPQEHNGIEEVGITVNAISDSYVGSGIARRSSSDLTASGATVTAPAGYYAASATKSVASGTAGTPTATKGAVSNHSVQVTPSVQNSAGYIQGGTHSGSPVSVSASELVSGSETKTANGTYDVTNLAQLVVNVSGGGGDSKNVQIIQSTTRTTSTSYTKLCGDITVEKTGTYDVYWTGFRSSTSGTWGTQLYIGSTAYGTAQSTFNNHVQNVHLSNVSLTANQKVSVYGRSRGSNYYAYVGQLTIIEA